MRSQMQHAPGGIGDDAAVVAVEIVLRACWLGICAAFWLVVWMVRHPVVV